MTTNVAISETITPADQNELIAVVADCFSRETAIYPLGGGTSLDYGLPAKREGIGLSLSNLPDVVDFPARDLTITVEAGITMQQLSDKLASESLMLPIDVPQPQTATLGGVIATNFNGPRRYGHGGVRDYVIGIAAVDGRGRPFHGGGRVVKNVAGYDFCKLLTGSLGTLGVITEVTLKLKPSPEASAFLLAGVDSLSSADALVAALVTSETTPTAIDLVVGPEWANDPVIGPLLHGRSEFAVAVGLEGTPPEVEWMVDTLRKEWTEFELRRVEVAAGGDAERLSQRLANYPQATPAALVLKASLLPSHTSKFIAAALEIDANCSVQAHAGNGLVIVRFPELPAEGLSRSLIQKLSPVAGRGQGNVVVLSNPDGAEMTHQSVWGGINAPFALMSEVKRQFDPANILNPGRFVYTRSE